MSHRRAKEIFLDAIELPEQERSAFVARACGEDRALRAQVEEMLRLHLDSADVLDRPALALDQNWLGLRSAAAPRRSEQPGDKIGRYRLISALGEGGFGAVFLAEQMEPVVRQVALKVIKRGMDTEQVIARFELERQALAMMDHPGIARVLDAGATESGRPYFVMEFVEGKPITTFAADQQLSIGERLELIEQACLAVQHAHQKGIIHRDLKPGNILVTLVDQRPVVKVIDFGVAKAVETDSASPTMTLETQIVGTPQYMSPEQATTGATRIDTRTDVYSLGTVLYELITGAPPFDPAELRRAGIERLCQIIREETPVKPSTRIVASGDSTAHGIEPRMLRRQVSGEIDWIVMKALEKEPGRRYQSPAELAEDIRLHLSHRAVRAGPPSRLYQFRKFARRHRVSLTAAVLVAISLFATAATATLMASRARRAEAEARQQADRAQRELARANTVVAFTDDLLRGIGPGVARGRDTALLRDLLDQSIRRAGSAFPGQPTLELTFRNIIAEALYDLGDSNAALEQLRGIFDATRATPDRDDPARLRAGRIIADILFDKFDPPQAESIVTEIMEGYRRSGQEESDDAYAARLALAGVYMRSGRNAQAEALLRSILEHYRKIGKAETDVGIRAWNNLALCIGWQDRWEEAAEEWKQLNALDRRVYGDDHPYTQMTTVDIGTAMLNLRRFDEAEKYLNEALVTARKIFPPGHPLLLTNFNNLASLLLTQHKPDAAEPILLEAYETGRPKLSTLDQPMDTLLLLLAQMRSQQGRSEECLKFISQLHEALVAKYGPRDPKTVTTLPLLLHSLLRLGRAAEGVTIVEQVGDFPESISKDGRLILLATAGHLYLGIGDEQSARQYAARARGLLEKDAKTVPSALRALESQLAAATTAPGN